MRIGLDTILVVRKGTVNGDDFDAINKLCRSSTSPIRSVILEFNHIKHISDTLNQIYRSILSSCWQDYPLSLVVIFNDRVSYTVMSSIARGLRLISSLTISKVIYVKTYSEMLAFTASYPSPATVPIEEANNLIYLSNSVRERCIILLANHALAHSDYRLDIIGWNEFEAMTALQIGFTVRVYDLDFQPVMPPLFNDLYADVDYGPLMCGAYAPPDLLKLRFLHSLMWSYASHNLLYIGAAPGLTLTDAILGTKRLRKDGGTVILMDPGFKRKDNAQQVQKLKNCGYSVDDSSFTYDEVALHECKMLTAELPLCINDDAYVSQRRQWEFTKTKLKFYASLFMTRAQRNLETIVILKFQPNGMVVPQIEVTFLKDVIFQPASNDSTELRLLLTHDGKTQTLNKNVLLNSLSVWRRMPLKEQLHTSSYYFRHIILKDNALDRKHMCNTLACYALTSAVPTGHKGIEMWKGVFDRYATSNLYSFVAVLPPNVITEVDGSVVTTDWGGRRYIDITTARSSLWKLKAFSFNPIIVLPSFDYNYAYDISRCFVMKKDLHGVPTCLMSGLIMSDFLPQSAYSSPGPLIKCFTLDLRLTNALPNNFTYQTRLRLVKEMTNINSLDVIFVADSDVTFKSVREQSLQITSGPLTGRTMRLSPQEDVAVSGHLLNILLAVRFGIDVVKLWIEQWKAQVSAVNGEPTYIRRLIKYRDDGVLFDYNPDGKVGILDRWHSDVDLVLALAIANQYMVNFSLEPFSDEELRTLLRQSCV